MRPSTNPRTTRASRALFALSVLLGVLACAVDRAGWRTRPLQGWWKGHGLVVPHDSFPADCKLCHTGTDWQTIRDDFQFDHEAQTGVALVGPHARAQCLRCHNDRGPVSVFAQRGCAGCHEDVHKGRLGSGCEDCHDPAEERFRTTPEVEAHLRTRFPLVGAHVATPCWRCHPGSEVGNFSNADVECVACHAGELAQAQQPDHAALGWVNACDRCHIPTTWTGSGFNHGTFPLTGAHASTDCSACHAKGVYTGTPRSCVACHQQDYDNASDPDHRANSFPTSCEQCHSTSSWQGAVFNHAGIRTGCVQCHLDEYKGTTRPNHSDAGFPTSCEQCHNTSSWEGAVFTHAGIRTGCVECHLGDYQGTTRPNHKAAGFPTSCEICHQTRSWTPATFDHRFPITTGHHANLDCGDCHPNPRNFAAFTCISCHTHSQREMDGEHDDVRGYVYESNACLSCHPSGQR